MSNSHESVKCLRDELTEIYKRNRKSDQELDGLLFHYTDARGLVGIFSDRALWASGADFLNDSSEPSYATEMLNEVLGKLALEPRYKDTVAQSWLNNIWKEYLELTYEREGPHLYVFCLSEHDDTLSQWRAYGAQCAGYALGFDAISLKDSLKVGQYLVKVTYSKQEQTEEARRTFKEILDLGLKVQNCPDFTEMISNLVRSALFSQFFWLRAKFKHPAFREEGEWRVVHFQSKGDATSQNGNLLEVSFRSSSSRVVPYVELHGLTMTVKKITCGAPLDTQSLRRLTSICPNVEIGQSAIPYRT